MMAYYSLGCGFRLTVTLYAGFLPLPGVYCSFLASSGFVTDIDNYLLVAALGGGLNVLALEICPASYFLFIKA